MKVVQWGKLLMNLNNALVALSDLKQVAVEAVTAEARSDERLVEARVLRFGGADWRIVGAEHVGGRAVLNLERVR